MDFPRFFKGAQALEEGQFEKLSHCLYAVIDCLKERVEAAGIPRTWFTLHRAGCDNYFLVGDHALLVIDDPGDPGPCEIYSQVATVERLPFKITPAQIVEALIDAKHLRSPICFILPADVALNWDSADPKWKQEWLEGQTGSIIKYLTETRSARVSVNNVFGHQTTVAGNNNFVPVASPHAQQVVLGARQSVDEFLDQLRSMGISFKEIASLAAAVKEDAIKSPPKALGAKVLKWVKDRLVGAKNTFTEAAITQLVLSNYHHLLEYVGLK